MSCPNDFKYTHNNTLANYSLPRTKKTHMTASLLSMVTFLKKKITVSDNYYYFCFQFLFEQSASMKLPQVKLGKPKVLLECVPLLFPTASKEETNRLFRLCLTMVPLIIHNITMKKRSERRKHCTLAVVRWNQKFLCHRRPPSRWRGTAKI